MTYQNSPTEQSRAIESDIRQTRNRMDNTIDRLGERMQWRHVLNDVLDFWHRRGDNGDHNTGEKLKASAQRVGQAVVAQVRDNPIPTILIGAGIAYLVFDRARERRRGSEWSTDDTIYDYSHPGVSDYASADMPTDADPYATGMGEMAGGTESTAGASGLKQKAGETVGHLKDKASAAAGRIRETAQQVKDRAAQRTGALRARASDLSHRAGMRLQEGYQTTRQKVVQTADEHPLALGVTCLALGLVAGLALPRTRRENELVGEAADSVRHRVKDKSRELLETGKHVVQAGVEAAKHEAQAQGLTPEGLKERVGAVASQAKDAAQRTAANEGLPGVSEGSSQPAGPSSPSSRPPGSAPQTPGPSI